MDDRSPRASDVAMGAAAGRRSVAGAFVLRQAEPGDVAAIASLENAAFTDPWSAAEFSSLVGLPRAIFLVAVEVADDRVAGYAIVSTVLDEAEVLNLAVSPARRGLGVGAMLLDAAVALAGVAGATSVFLEVRESNAAARGLYASRGFSEISRRRRYYAKPVEDALVLRGAVQR